MPVARRRIGRTKITNVRGITIAEARFSAAEPHFMDKRELRKTMKQRNLSLSAAEREAASELLVARIERLGAFARARTVRSEEHTSELQSRH